MKTKRYKVDLLTGESVAFVGYADTLPECWTLIRNDSALRGLSGKRYWTTDTETGAALHWDDLREKVNGDVE